MSDTTAVLDFETMEKSFNSSLANLRKSLGVEDEPESKTKVEDEQLEKASKDYDEDAEETEDEDEEDEEVDDEEAKGVKKSMSIEDQLAQEPDAEAAIDVAPFLKSLVIGIDRKFAEMQKSLDEVSTLAKSIGHAQLSGMELAKSQTLTVNRIAQQDQKTVGIKRMQKPRFEGDNSGSVDIDSADLLQKSSDWLNEGKLSLLEAGQIESRINKETIGTLGDALDSKVAKLVKEAK